MSRYGRRGLLSILIDLIPSMGGRRIATTVIFIIAVIYLFVFAPSNSTLVCSHNKCNIIKKNILGANLGNQPVDFSNIDEFYVSTSYYKGSKKYYIYARTKDGYKKMFFPTYDKNRYIADQTVDALNKLLESSDKNINIKY